MEKNILNVKSLNNLKDGEDVTVFTKDGSVVSGEFAGFTTEPSVVVRTDDKNELFFGYNEIACVVRGEEVELFAELVSVLRENGLQLRVEPLNVSDKPYWEDLDISDSWKDSLREIENKYGEKVLEPIEQNILSEEGNEVTVLMRDGGIHSGTVEGIKEGSAVMSFSNGVEEYPLKDMIGWTRTSDWVTESIVNEGENGVFFSSLWQESTGNE